MSIQSIQFIICYPIWTKVHQEKSNLERQLHYECYFDEILNTKSITSINMKSTREVGNKRKPDKYELRQLPAINIKHKGFSPSEIIKLYEN